MNEKEMRKSIELATIVSRQEQRVEFENTTAHGQIQWVGGYWTCNKQFKHYGSFCVNGVNIYVCSFCHIKIQDSEPGVAYILDLYEDKKSQKKMKVRWLHKVEEIKIPIPPPEPLAQEVFMTQSCQVLRVECCNGVVYVLSLYHYATSGIPSSVPYVYVCLRSFEFTKFDITTMEGYWRQDIFKTELISQNLRDIAIAESSPCKNAQSGLSAVGEYDQEGSVPTIKKAPRSARKRLSGRYDFMNEEGDWTRQLQEKCWLNYDSIIAVTTSPSNLLKSSQDSDPGEASLAFTSESCWGRIGDKVEVLSQDSGMRGCWFRCTVLETEETSIKLRYDDIREVDSDIILEGWESITASEDQPGFRIPGRQNMRPPPPEMESSSPYELGSAVDAWGGEGWWEGIIIDRNSTGQVKVGVPGEEFAVWFQDSNVRTSREWVGGQWLAVRPETNIFDKVSGLHTKRLVSSQVPEFCPENDRIFSREFLPGFTVSCQCPCFQSTVRQKFSPVKGSKSSLTTKCQANEALDFNFERSANQALAYNLEKVKRFCSNPNSAAFETASQTPIFTEFKESTTLLTRNSECSGKVYEPCPSRDHEEIDRSCDSAYSCRPVFEESHSVQLAKLQQLDVVRDNEHTADFTPAGVRLLRVVSRKQHQDVDSLLASPTKTSLFLPRDSCANVQAQVQEDLTEGKCKINTLTDIGNVEFSHSRYGLNGVNSSTSAPHRGHLFNCVSVQSLVLSR